MKAPGTEENFQKAFKRISTIKKRSAAGASNSLLLGCRSTNTRALSMDRYRGIVEAPGGFGEDVRAGEEDGSPGQGDLKMHTSEASSDVALESNGEFGGAEEMPACEDMRVLM